MNAAVPGRAGRWARRTALLVGEGLAEELFLRHLKSLYVTRGDKVITVKNAKGKGGRQVLDYTRGQCRAYAYDEAAALLDTDTDWDEAQRALARRSGIVIFEARPCLEALLLSIAGHEAPGLTSDCKRVFMKRFDAQAHADAIYVRHFARDVLDAARNRVAVLDRLISYLTG